MVDKSEGYEYMAGPLPKVKILCRDERGEEEVTVIEDCLDPNGPSWDIRAVFEACEDAYKEWAARR